MSQILANYKEKFPVLNEVYEVVKTVEVVNSARNQIRIEILKYYTDPSIKYKARYCEIGSAHLQSSYPREGGAFVREQEDKRILWDIDFPWVETIDSETALLEALKWVSGSR